MKRESATNIIIIISVFILLILSALFIVESIRFKTIKENAGTRFNEIGKWFNEGNFSEYKANLSVYSNNLPNLTLLVVKKADKTPVYLFSRMSINPDNQNQIFDREKNSFFNTFFQGNIRLNNRIYTLETVFNTFPQERLFLLFAKLSAVIFIYLIFLFSFLLYFTKSAESNNTEALNTIPGTDTMETDIKQNSEKPAPPELTMEADEDTDSVEQESYKEKIGNELKKAAAFDQDIVLVLISSPGNVISQNSRKFHDILTRNFPFHDLIFHYSENVFALLLPNTDLEQGIHQVELFDQIFVSSTETLKFPVMFGLSSRNGRLISGHTIVKEANAALHKAMCEPHYPIIGFRPNPARYREYLSRIKPENVKENSKTGL